MTKLGLACLVLVACGPEISGAAGSGGSAGAGGGSGSGGSAGSATGGSGGSAGVDGGPGADGPTCGVQMFALQRRPPDLLIVLDKSGSMADPPSSGGASKWVQVTTAINQSVMATQSQILWGLQFFPSDSGCGVGTTPDVAVALNDYPAISTAIAGKSPGGLTPTHQAELNAGAYLAALADGNTKYIVLATDGAPNCTGPNGMFSDATGTENAITTVAQMGIPTFVIGVSTDSTTDAILNTMAQNGGEARPSGPPYYYPANDQASFLAAIQSIEGQVVSCTFPLTQRPPDPSLVSVTADGNTVPQDTSHMNGWDFGAGGMSIIFYGTWCTRLQQGMITDVQTIFGCPPVMIRN